MAKGLPKNEARMMTVLRRHKAGKWLWRSDFEGMPQSTYSVAKKGLAKRGWVETRENRARMNGRPRVEVRLTMKGHEAGKGALK